METQKAIIERVLGNPVRSSNYGLPGEKHPSPYAAVDDNTRQVHLHFPSQDVATAVAELLDYCREWYPTRTAQAEADLMAGEEA